MSEVAMEIEAREMEREPVLWEWPVVEKEAGSLFAEMMEEPGPTLDEMEAFNLFSNNNDLVAKYRLKHPSLDSSNTSSSTLLILRPTNTRSATDDIPIEVARKAVQICPPGPRRQSTSDLPTLATTRTIDSLATSQGSRKRSPSPFKSFLRYRRQSEMSVDEGPLIPTTPPITTAIVIQDLRPAPRKLRKPRVTPELQIQTPSNPTSPSLSPKWTSVISAEPENHSPHAERPSNPHRRSWRTSFPGFSNPSANGKSPASSLDVSPTTLTRSPSPLSSFPSSARREGALPPVEKDKSKSRPKRGSGNSSDSYHGDAEGNGSTSNARPSSSNGSPPSPSSTRNAKWNFKMGFGGKKVPRSDSGRSDTSSWEWVSDGGAPSPVSPTFEVFRRPIRRPSFSRSKSATSVESGSQLSVPTALADLGTLATASTSSPNLTKIDETLEPAATLKRPPPLLLPSATSPLDDHTPKASPTLNSTTIEFSSKSHSMRARQAVSLLTQSRPASPASRGFLVERQEGDGGSSGEEDDPAGNYRLTRSPALPVLGPTHMAGPSDSDLSFTHDSVSERDEGDETPASSAVEDEDVEVDERSLNGSLAKPQSGWVHGGVEGVVANE